MNAQTSTVDALVVGAGPVGLTLALHLQCQGLRCRIVDRSPSPSDKSKALVLWARTLEMLDDLGIVHDFLTAGMFLKAASLHGGSRLLARIPFHATGTNYPQPLMLAQSETERLLIEHLGQVGIPVERPVELTALTDQGDHVLATLHHSDGQEQVRCDYLIGCDGAHSTVRSLADLNFTGEAEPNDWVLADCRVEGPIPLDELSLFWHHKGVLAFFPFGPRRCRVIADMGKAKGSGHPLDPSLDQIQTIVNERGPAGIQLSEPHWLSGFRIHERKVADYRRGRVFLVGDAAHIHSPAGGQGMNTGMQDAWNLAWKLALVKAGQARPDLLDSYTLERGKVGEIVLRNATLLTRTATLRNPLAQFLRNRLVGVLGLVPAFRKGFVQTLMELNISYPSSPLNGQSRSVSWRSGIHPGDRIPNTPLRKSESNIESSLLSVLRSPRHNLLLLARDGQTATLPALLDISRRVGETYPGLINTHLILGHEAAIGPNGPQSAWVDSRCAILRFLGARESAAALVRPDKYLGYRGQPPSWEDLRKHLDRYLIARAG